MFSFFSFFFHVTFSCWVSFVSFCLRRKFHVWASHVKSNVTPKRFNIANTFDTSVYQESKDMYIVSSVESVK